MKGKDAMKTALWIPAIVLLVMAMGIVQAAVEKSPMVLFQEALYQEETEGDLDKAIELYQQVLEEAAEVERIAARTTYQLGMCHLKKGEKEKAIEYFQEVVSYYPEQTSAVRKAQKQLEKIAPETTGGSLYDQATQAVWSTIGSMYGQTCAKAGMKNLYTNSNIHFVNSDFDKWYGGYGFYTNTTQEPVSGRVRLSGTTIPNQKHYDIMGNPLDTEILPDERPGREKYYNIYLDLPQPVASMSFFAYGWAVDGSSQLPLGTNRKHQLVMQNHFGSHAFEVFYLIIPNNLRILEPSEPYTGKQTVSEFTIYAWEKEVQPDENHLVMVTLSKKRDVSSEELVAIVEKAVLTISTCAETDPKIKKAMNTLEGLDEQKVISELSNYFDSETANIRRSTIYILYKGDFSDISAAEEKLLELCTHQETATRGMAALALGQNKIAAAYDALVNMTLNDKDGFPRRCGAYALGLLGDPKALPVLEQALQDTEDMVKGNAQAAITMLTKLNDEPIEVVDTEPALTQEMHNDIQPDGTIKFWNPEHLVNSGSEPITERRFINSDFVELAAMADEHGNPVEFTAKHEGNIYRYHIIFDPPVMPGETFVYNSEGTITGLVKPVANENDTYRYYMTHSPASGVPTLRIEEYVLPEGAELLSTMSEDMVQSEKDGRIMLRIEKVIPAGGNLTTSFKYRLDN
jgi:hypothetical protein